MTTRPSTTRRPGLTLTEALVALFIAAIGMMALMTLFPLAALQMGQALKDERTSQLAVQADAKMRWHWQTFVVEGGQADYTTAMTNPAGVTPAAPSEPSYPVFVDPIGFTARNGTDQTWVGGTAYNPTTFAVPRKTLFAFANNYGYNADGLNTTQEAVQFCSLLDDLTYTADGRPDPALTVERQGRYNWSAVVQRTRGASTTSADLTIVVFDGRAPGYAPTTGNEKLEWAYPMRSANTPPNQFEPGTTSVTIVYDPATEKRPAVSKGRWVMDATTKTGTNPTDPNLRHAKFYRVVSVNDETAGQLVLELDKPITRSDGQTANYNGTLVVLDGVAEVFHRPPLTPQSGQ